MDQIYIVAIIGLASIMLILVLLLAVLYNDDSRVEVGKVFTPLFPEPLLHRPATNLPPKPTAPTPEQKSKTRAGLEKRETRLRTLIRDTQSKF